MNAQQFLAEFGHVANAPGGVNRLRELIRGLAIQGKLISQELSDSKVNDLLLEIATEKRRLTSMGKMRRERPWAPIAEHEIRFPIPSSWRWLRFGEITINRDGERVPVASVDRDKVDKLYDYYGASGVIDKIDRFLFDQTLLLVSEDGANLINRSTPIAFLASGQYWVNNHAHVIDATHSGILRYLALFLNSISLAPYVTGTAQPKLNQARLSDIAIAVPPPEEQSRIVAKVDELMALCDQLEKQQQERRKLQNALRQSTLQALASAQSPHELRMGWERLQASFGQLFSEPEDADDVIAELKNLAVRGVLVEASRAAPDLARVTADCSALRSEYIATGWMRRQKLVGMAESELTYPEHWAVAAFDEVAVVMGGVTKGRDLRGKRVVVCPYLAVANVQRGYFKLEGLKSIEIAEDELPKYLVHDGDLLMTEGGDWDKVGRTAIWRGGVENCLHQNHVFKARVPSKQLLKEWVELVFNSGIGRDYFAGASKQTTNLASINMTQLRSFPLPIPPLEEQQRILVALTTLTDLCEEWRHQLKHRRDLAALFAAVCVSALTGINIEQAEDTSVKGTYSALSPRTDH